MADRGRIHPRRGGPRGGYPRNMQRHYPRDDGRDFADSSRTNQSRTARQRQQQQPGALSPGDRPHGDTRHLQLLRFALLEEEDPSRRHGNAVQLIKSLEEFRQCREPAEFQQECLHLLEPCLMGSPELRTALESLHPRLTTVKGTLIKLLALLSAGCGRLDIVLKWLFDVLGHVPEAEGTPESNRLKELRLWLLRALRQIMLEATTTPYTKRQLIELSANISTSLVLFLDAMETSDYLADVLQVLEVLAAQCPNAFADKFQDFIDLLVGWHIDPSLSDSRKAVIGESYIKFRGFWQSRLPFGFELLHHFLDDMNEAVKGLSDIRNLEDENKSADRRKWTACENLFSCFHAVLKAIIPLLSSQEARKDAHIIDSTFDRLRRSALQFLCSVRELCPNDAWIQKSNRVILLMFTVKPHSIRLHQWEVYEYFASQIHQLEGSSDDEPLAYIKMVMQLIDAWTPDIDENIIRDVLDFSRSPILQLNAKFRSKRLLRDAVLTLVRVLIRLCPAMDDLRYQIISSLENHLRDNLTALLANRSEDMQNFVDYQEPLQRISAEMRKLDKLMVSNYESTAIEKDTSDRSTDNALDSLFITYLLLDIAHVWPSYREEASLSATNTVLVAWNCGQDYLFDVCLDVFREFWCRNGLFLDSPEEFRILCCFVQDILQIWNRISLGCRQSLTATIKDILTKLPSVCKEAQLEDAAMQHIILSLLQAFDFERNNALKISILKIAVLYCKQFDSYEIVKPAITTAQKGLDYPCPYVQDASIELLAALNPFVTTDLYVGKSESVRILQNAVMATPHTGTFRPPQFERVMKGLGMGSRLIGQGADDMSTDPYRSSSDISANRRRLFHFCDSLGSMKNTSGYAELKEELGLSELIKFANESMPFLRYWAAWESARYCILARLRTPFGGPQQTLEAFRWKLSSLVSATDPNARDNDTYFEELSTLLLLLDRFEVQTYNAWNGSATNALPAVPRSSLTFFRTNKKACLEFFSKLRRMIIEGAKILADDDLLIRNILEMLAERENEIAEATDMLSWFQQTNYFMRDLVNACIRRSASDLIHGLSAWYKKLIRKATHVVPSFRKQYTFVGLIGPLPNDNKHQENSSTATWFHASEMFAEGRYEDACDILYSLHSLVARDEYGILDMLDTHAFDFYTSAEDYDSLCKLLDENNSLSANILSRELIHFSSQLHAKQSQPECTLADYHVALQNANIEDSLRLSRLVKFRDWLADNDKAQDDTGEEIVTLIAKQARAALRRDILDKKANMLEIQLAESPPWKLRKDAEVWAAKSASHKLDLKTCRYTSQTKYWSRVLSATEHLARDTRIEDFNTVVADIRLHAAKISHLCGNLRIAERWLDEASRVAVTRHDAMYERARVMLSRNSKSPREDAMRLFRQILDEMEVTRETDGVLRSKIYLEMAKMLKGALDESEEEAILLSSLDRSFSTVNNPTDRLIHETETTVDDYFEKSVLNAEQYGRPWFEYATYNYKQGWRLLDDIRRSKPSTSVAIWARSEIHAIIETQCKSEADSSEKEKNICGLVQKFSTAFGAATSYKEDLIRQTLAKISLSLEAESVSKICDILNAVESNVIDRFRASTVAYFRYLSLDDETKKTLAASTSMVMTATLRLLRILVRYGDALQSVFMENIASVRIEPWKRIIPQLFARLNHPAPVVQQAISKLLIRICEEYPSEIIYDVIVSSTSTKTNRETKNVLNHIASRMMLRDEALWTSTQRMAEELEKITVLWEEKWVYKISSLTFTVMELFRKLDQEVDRLKHNNPGMTQDQADNSFLESYDNVMKFVVSSLQKLLQTTILTTGQTTPHERWFIETFGKQLVEAFEMLQKPKSMSTYKAGWKMFLRINSDLQFQTQKVRILELSQVSPYLASLGTTVVAVPGTNVGDSCFIERFGTNVVVLPTKTKPKKLDLRGSNGQKYSYLFKGLEDLHLDERIMQLLNTVNGLLKEDGATVSRGLKTRTYAVIPLSDHSGMIQWVNDAIPLFALYKRWQAREHNAQALMAGDRAMQNEQQPIQRPTEIFVNKVLETLKERGLRVTTNRRHWPKSVLKEVYLKLVKETPGDLLAKEVWCSSSDASDWFAKSTSLSRSLAVMSVIGYIIGLGDRHLDNILVDFRSGEVIHIDYNICFEKGKQLRVPELVPFRLTQNLLQALGITGVDGLFRIAAEETLRVLRKHKEVLMTLLDAFVYDPLVHWTNEAGEMEERQIMDLQGNLGLISTRLGEKRLQYEQLQNAVFQSLKAVIEMIDQLQEDASKEENRLEYGDGSDEEDNEMETENRLEYAKRRIREVAQGCRLWFDKHRAIYVTHIEQQESGLDDLLSQKYLTPEIALPTSATPSATLADDFAKAVAEWRKFSDSLYGQCAKELNAYRQMVQQFPKTVRQQDICRIWDPLEKFASQGYQKADAEYLYGYLQSDQSSVALREIQNRASHFTISASTHLERLESTLARARDVEERPDAEIIERGQRIDSGAVMHKLAYSLSHSAFRFEQICSEQMKDGSRDETFEDHSEAIEKELQSLETDCYIGFYGDIYNAFGLLSLSVYAWTLVGRYQEYLGGMLGPNELETLSMLVPCAIDLYRLEENYLYTCSDVMQLCANSDSLNINQLERSLVDSPSVDENGLLDLFCKTGGLEEVAGNSIFLKLQQLFGKFDQLCAVIEVDESLAPVFEGSIKGYKQCRQQVVMRLIQECLNLLEVVYPEGPVPELIFAEALIYNDAIRQHLAQFSSAVSDILCSLGKLLLTSVSARLDTALGEEYQPQAEDEIQFHTTCIDDAREHLLKMFSESKDRIAACVEKTKYQMQYFQWFYAPYLQSRKPILPNELLALISNGPEKLHQIGAGLRELMTKYNDFTKQIRQGENFNEEQWRAQFQTAYNAELRKCTALMDIYNTINHLESCRDGFAQATILATDIEETLRVFMTDETGENVPGALDDQIVQHISSENMQKIQEQLSAVSQTLSILKSPVDGVVALLESIVVIEVDANNELKPAQQTAKSTLESIASVESILASIASKDGKDWTYQDLMSSIHEVSRQMEQMFGCLRTLEEFGPDKQTEENVLHEGQTHTEKDKQDIPNSDTIGYSDYQSPGDHTELSGSQALDKVMDSALAPENHSKLANSVLTTTYQQHISTAVDQDESANGCAGIPQPVAQRRDEQVLGIMRRIREKLEGKDFNVQHRMDVSEQVTKMIEQATSVDNLSLMYEGWTSWV